jgi:putative transcriptional regulator
MYSKLYFSFNHLDFYMELGNKLKQLRFENDNLSQQALANAVGVTRLTIHSIENAKFNPSTILAMKIARFFEMSVEEVFYLKDETD